MARRLDREQVALFSLGITAEDDGTPPGNVRTECVCAMSALPPPILPLLLPLFTPPLPPLLLPSSSPPPPQGTTTLQVTITDVNDERPEFVLDTYFARVPENSPQGTQVLPVRDGSGRV